MIHPYQIFLESSEIEHRRTKVARSRTNSFVERSTTVLDEYFLEKLYASVEELQGTWISGFTTTTTRGRIEDTATWADGPLKPSKPASCQRTEGDERSSFEPYPGEELIVGGAINFFTLSIVLAI